MAMTACGGPAAENTTATETAPLSGSVFNDTEATTEEVDVEALLQSIVGTYSNGRAMMTVSARGNDKAAISVTWGSSAANTSDTSAKEAKATVPRTVSITADVLDDLHPPIAGSDVLHEPIHID